MKQAISRIITWCLALSLCLASPLQASARTQIFLEGKAKRLCRAALAAARAEGRLRPTEPVIEAGSSVVEAARQTVAKEAAKRQVTVEEAQGEPDAEGQENAGGRQDTEGQDAAGERQDAENQQTAWEQQGVGNQQTTGEQQNAEGQQGAGSQEGAAGQQGMGSQQGAAGQQIARGPLDGPDISSPSAILMEASTGQVIYEKNADEKRSPASITKIMTLILIFDALESGKITMADQVVTSAYAKSMGGSQVFLEEGEVQTVETLIKCIVVASGNDASVAMAEYIAGDEKTFVDMMNQRAQGLGMAATHFEDCCGLTESRTHVTSARDIAIMSRELINHYPQIHNYSTIWMDTITHVTSQGTKEFGLSNTNKLLKMATNFQVTGLKTGSTSLAKYCLSATAEKEGVRLIAAIMAAPDFRVRFADAATLLNYGYANCRLYEDKEPPALPMLQVDNGVEDQVALQYAGIFSYLGLRGEDFSNIERKLLLETSLPAPIELGQKAGGLEYWLNGEKLGEISVLTAGSVKAASYVDYLRKMLRAWCDLAAEKETSAEEARRTAEPT